MTTIVNYIDGVTDDRTPWYAVWLFILKLKEVRTYFTGRGLGCFVPEQYVDVRGRDGKPHSVLRPVVRNLIFVKMPGEDISFRKIVQEVNYKISVIKKAKDSQEYALTPHGQMYEPHLMCNPEVMMRKFLFSDGVQIKTGNGVLVKFGSLKGMTG